MLVRNMMIKLAKKKLERARPHIKANNELLPKLQRQAHTCGNALAVVFLRLHKKEIDFLRIAVVYTNLF